MDFELANALGRAVELKDMSTAAHTWRVTMYAQALGEACGFSTDRLLTFMQGAVLHDIGKLDIPPEILTKPDKLTSDEYEIIKTHTTLGYERMIKMGETNPIILNIVRSHHERLDGSGYPDGLKGEAIPYAARILAIADVFDALTALFDRGFLRVDDPKDADGVFGFLSLDTTATMGHSDAEVRIDSAATAGQCSAAQPVWTDLSADGFADLALGCSAEPLGGQARIFFADQG